MTQHILIVGAGRVGRNLAQRLQNRNEHVILIEQDEETVDAHRPSGYTIRHGDGTAVHELEAAGIENARVLVAATGDDDSNLLISQLANSKFDVDRVVARVNTPSNVDSFEELGIRSISSDRATARSLDNAIERPSLSHWMTSMEQGGDVQEIELTVAEFVGKSVTQLDRYLPDGVLIALIDREGHSQMPDPGFVLEHGDRLTLLGREDAVEQAYSLIHPEQGTAESSVPRQP